ncbi:hypothetical protein AAMO2058_000818900 [Amorphochlora amoebiformis]
MATKKLARLQLTLRDGSSRKRIVLKDIDLSINLTAFQEFISPKVDIPTHFQVLEVMDSQGLRPKFRVLDMSMAGMSLEAHGIKSGHSLQIKDLRREQGATTIRQGKGWEYPKSIDKHGRMEKEDIPRDNSCLFHAIASVTDQKGKGEKRAYDMRLLAANTIRQDPRTFNSTFLGMPNANYVNVVMDPNQWGGGIELAIFSQHFGIEIIAFDIHSLREDMFGQGDGYKKRCFLLYTGEHYDILRWMDSKGNPQRLFSVKDTQAWEKARVIVQSMHEQAAKSGKCKLQKEWRREIKRKTVKYTGGSNKLGTAPFPKPTETETLTTTPSREKEAKRSAASSEKRVGFGACNRSLSIPESKKNSRGSKKPTAKSDKKTKTKEKKDDSWSCSACTYVNVIMPDRCQVCRTANPNYRPDPELFPEAAAAVSQMRGEPTPSNDSLTPQRLIDTTPEALSVLDPNIVQQLQLASLQPWICPNCRVLNPRGTLRCALTDCLYPNPIVGGAVPRPTQGQNSTQGECCMM